MVFIPNTPDLKLDAGQCAYEIVDDRITFTKIVNGNPVHATRRISDDTPVLDIDTRSWTPQETLALFQFKPATADDVPDLVDAEWLYGE